MALVLKRLSGLGLALVLVACGRSDRNFASSTQSGSPSIGVAGPQALVLRVPRGGGAPRVDAYPRVDSIVWTSTDPAPTPQKVLAFDDESGSVAYEDTRGRPVLLDLRVGTISVPSSKKLSALASATGGAIYGIAPTGEVVRLTPTGEWTFRPPHAAKALFPQSGGALLVVVGAGANTRLLKLFPPDTRVLDSIPFPAASKTVRTQLGDRLYIAVDSGLVVLRTRTMDWAPSVAFSEPIRAMASTPSGDRVFVLTDARTKISVVDRYRDRVSAVFHLPGPAEDLRIDPFGRYLLVRSARGIWVIAIGTQRVLGELVGGWRSDLPFVAYDGRIGVVAGDDVVFYDGETLKARSRIRGGGQDYWYQFLWDGFRPRAAALDVPVRFDTVALGRTGRDSVGRSDSTAIVSDTATSKGFVVSFAAFLAEDRAKELASRIHVGGENARVVATSRVGSTIYRVILGPFLSKEEAEKAGRDSGHSYWVYEGLP